MNGRSNRAINQMTKTVLIVGSGSRENALAWKLKQSPKVEKIFIAPGNPGTAKFGKNVDIAATDVLALADFAQKNNIDLTTVGPEDPLALGVVDEFQKRSLKIWGPSKAAAQIESSKVFSKELMKQAGIPTAEYQTFTDYNKALEYVESHFKGSVPIHRRSQPPINGHATDTQPIVIKASGLALGKGVTICQTLDEAKAALNDAMVKKIFGESGSEVVIEEFLEGMEFSAHAFSDGKNFRLLPCSQDHKRIFEGDQGPNTGGIGTIAPLPWITQAHMDTIATTIVAPTLKALQEQGSPFVGLLYPGLIMTKTGPKVIEFNCRFGGPECESYMRILKTDLLDILEACVEGKLNELKIEWHETYACCIILCSKGYPDNYEKGLPISGIEEAEKLDDVIVFHAGTMIQDSIIVTNGGRVLGVTAVADDLKTALDKAYAAVKLIHFDGMHYRTDIGAKSLSTKD